MKLANFKNNRLVNKDLHLSIQEAKVTENKLNNDITTTDS